MGNKQKQMMAALSQLSKEQAENLAKTIYQTMNEHPGMTIKDATGISDEVLEEMYSLAYTFYNQGKYRESISLFEFLAGASPSTFKYVLGLAASYHQMGAYREAALGFYLAMHIDPENPMPAYYATDCFLKEKLYPEAQEFAEITSYICQGKPQYAELKNRCDLINKSLKRNNLN